MTRWRLLFLLAILLPVLSAIFPGAAWAGSSAGMSGSGGAGGAPTAAREALPPARPVAAVLDDSVAAVGGEAALRRHHSVHTKMEITFKGLGITGTAEHYAAEGDKALTITEIPNLASTREGSDGKRFWSEDPINGLRILEGAEAEQARIEVTWNAELHTRELFKKIESSTERGDDGALLECLTLTPKLGAALVNCFDARTHLMAIQRGVRSSPQGDMPFTARLSDWRKVGDVKLAYATDMQVGPLAFIGRVATVEMDVPTTASLFAVPSSTRSARSTKAGKPGKGARPRE